MSSSTRAAVLRLVALSLFTFGLLAVAEATGLRRELSIPRLREMAQGAGLAGFAIYAAAFVVAFLIHVPGMICVCAGILIWGRLWGAAAAWGAGLLAISAGFFVARVVGGQPAALLERPGLRPLFEQLHARPIRTVALLRALMVVSPPVTLALAISRVPYRTMLLGSAIGLVPPLIVTSLFLDRVLRWIAP